MHARWGTRVCVNLLGRTLANGKVGQRGSEPPGWRQGIRQPVEQPGELPHPSPCCRSGVLQAPRARWLAPAPQHKVPLCPCTPSKPRPRPHHPHTPWSPWIAHGSLHAGFQILSCAKQKKLTLAPGLPVQPEALHQRLKQAGLRAHGAKLLNHLRVARQGGTLFYDETLTMRSTSVPEAGGLLCHTGWIARFPVPRRHALTCAPETVSQSFPPVISPSPKNP